MAAAAGWGWRVTTTRTPRPRATAPTGARPPGGKGSSSGRTGSPPEPASGKPPAGSRSDVEAGPTDEWGRLLDAWLTWSRSPADPGAERKLTAACREVAVALGVPSYRVGVLLADGLRQGLAHADVVARLVAGWRP